MTSRLRVLFGVAIAVFVVGFVGLVRQPSKQRSRPVVTDTIAPISTPTSTIGAETEPTTTVVVRQDEPTSTSTTSKPSDVFVDFAAGGSDRIPSEVVSLVRTAVDALYRNVGRNDLVKVGGDLPPVPAGWESSVITSMVVMGYHPDETRFLVTVDKDGKLDTGDDREQIPVALIKPNGSSSWAVDASIYSGS